MYSENPKNKISNTQRYILYNNDNVTETSLDLNNKLLGTKAGFQPFKLHILLVLNKW